MASSPDSYFVVESLVENAGAAPLILARRLDDHDFMVRDGSLLNGAPIAAADMPRALNAVGKARNDLWGFFLKSVTDLPRFAIGQTVKLEPAAGVMKPGDPIAQDFDGAGA